MGDAMTRVYRKGVLEAEDFAVSDVSVHLERARHRGVGRLLRPVQGPAARARGRARPARAGRRRRARPPSAPEARPLRQPSVPVRARRARRSRRGEFRPDGDRRLHQRALAHHRPQGRRVRHGAPCSSDGIARPTSLPMVSGSCSTACSTPLSTRYFDAIQSFDDYYEQVGEGIFEERPLEPSGQRQWFDMRQAMVRFHRLVVPDA